MDPISLLSIGLGTAVGDFARSNQEANASKKAAEAQSQIMERQALEGRASAQSEAAAARREAMLAQSRLGSVAAASGSGASDPSVMALWKGIEGEGQHNAAMATAAGEQRASGINYQSAVDRWSANTNARIKKAGAVTTLIGNLGSAYGDYGKTKMAVRYGGGTSSSYGSTGYGR